MSGESSVLHRHPKTRNFTQIENSTIRDSGLSYRATGLLIYLLSLKDGTRIDSISLAERKAEGRDAIRAAYKELESAGYVQRTQQARGNDGKWTTSIHVYEVPVPENPAPVDPAPGNPASETQALSLSESKTEGKEGELGSFACLNPGCDHVFDTAAAMNRHYDSCFIPADALPVGSSSEGPQR